VAECEAVGYDGDWMQSRRFLLLLAIWPNFLGDQQKTIISLEFAQTSGGQ
jgi:hypothetical protein